MTDYTLTREQMITRIRRYRDAEPSLDDGTDKNNHVWIVLNNLLADAEQRNIKTPQVPPLRVRS